MQKNSPKLNKIGGFLTKILPYSPWINFGGTALLLSGLGLDALLHKLNPSLLEEEGIFTLGNPGHLLLALGIGLLVANVMLYLLINAQKLLKRRASRKAFIFVVAAFWLLGLGGVNVYLALNSTDSLHIEQSPSEEPAIIEDIQSPRFAYYYSEESTPAQPLPQSIASQAVSQPASHKPADNHTLPNLYENYLGEQKGRIYYQPSKHGKKSHLSR